MLKLISELVVRIADLLEAEGRTLRQVVTRLIILAAMIAAVTALALAGVGLLLVAAYLGLSQAIGPSWAAAALGVASLALAGGLLWMNRDNMK